MTAAFGASTRATVGIIAELIRQIGDLEAELATHFEAHPDADIYRSLPGLGVVLGARVLGEFGDDPHRYTDRQIPQKLRRNLTINPRLRQETRRPGPPRPQPPTLRRRRPMGLLRTVIQPRRPRLLRPTPRSRRPPPQPCAPSATASSASCTAAYATRPTTTNTKPGHTDNTASRLTPYDPGMSSDVSNACNNSGLISRLAASCRLCGAAKSLRRQQN